MNILCPHCYRSQPDNGRRQTCEVCGTFPLPSVSYDPQSSFHPDNCNGYAKPVSSPTAARKAEAAKQASESLTNHLRKD